MRICFLPLLSFLLLLAVATAASADYKQKAEEQTDFIQAHYFDAKTGRYHPSYPIDLKALPYDFMWGNGVQLTALIGATREDPAKYKPWLYAFRQGLQSYWDPAVAIPGFNAYCSGPNGTDKYYDDNEWISLAYAEAYEVTHDKMFLDDARNTQKFVLSGWDDKLGGGIYWRLKHETKNTCSNAPAASASLRIYQVAGDKDQLEWGKKLHAWVDAHLKDTATDGLYWDSINPDTGSIGKAKWSYNTALMIRAEVLLYQIEKDKAMLAEARRNADAGLAAWTDPATGSLHKTENSPLFTHLFCEALLRLYDVTHDIKYLDAVRKEAAFAYDHCRDPKGGYWNNWKTSDHDPNERKKLIENAAVARMFWLLAPYPETGEPKVARK